MQQMQEIILILGEQCLAMMLVFHKETKFIHQIFLVSNVIENVQYRCNSLFLI